MRRLICAGILLLILGTSQVLAIDVDCDAGDDLGAVLNRLAKARPSGLLPGENSDDPVVGVIVNVTGTCVGNFVITVPGLLLLGSGPETTVLQGADPIQSVTPAVDVRGVRGVLFRDMTITGSSTGLRVRDSDAVIIGCEFRGNGTGLESRNSETIVADSLFTDNGNGIQSLAADLMSVNNTDVVGNDQAGIFVIGGSSLVVDGGEVSGNLFGIKVLNNARAFLRQPLVVGETTGGSHIDAVNHSTVTLNNGVVVSGSNDIEIVNQSLLEGFQADIGVDVQLLQFGHAVLRGTTIDGNLKATGFSNALLKTDTQVAGIVECDATSDTDCSGGTVGGVAGCGSCTP